MSCSPPYSLEAESLTETGTGLASASPHDLPLCSHSIGIRGTPKTMPVFYMGARDSDPVPQAFAAMPLIP